MTDKFDEMEMRDALYECRLWLEHRVMDIIPEADKPATQARIDLARKALGEDTGDG